PDLGGSPVVADDRGAVKDEIDLPPPVEIVLPGPSGHMEPCNNNQWKLRAIQIDWSEMFVEFAKQTRCKPLPASDMIVTTFLAWLDIARRSTEMLGCLAAIAKMHKLKGFHDPTKN
ncbi:30352_t:CDS:2, partial [Gigaspora margarita]